MQNTYGGCKSFVDRGARLVASAGSLLTKHPNRCADSKLIVLLQMQAQHNIPQAFLIFYQWQQHFDAKVQAHKRTGVCHSTSKLTCNSMAVPATHLASFHRQSWTVLTSGPSGVLRFGIATYRSSAWKAHHAINWPMGSSLKQGCPHFGSVSPAVYNPTVRPLPARDTERVRQAISRLASSCASGEHRPWVVHVCILESQKPFARY